MGKLVCNHTRINSMTCDDKKQNKLKDALWDNLVYG